MYCPRCGHSHITKFENNRPVADFFCPSCRSEYELKSKNGALGSKINDGAYKTMMERISGNKIPDLLLMSYSKQNAAVNDLIIIPKCFFVPDIIERRTPLDKSAHRAGWVGCNILFEKIPEQGRISIISRGTICDAESVIKKVEMSRRLESEDIVSRGWIMDILNCVNSMPADAFSLEEIYNFEYLLKNKHPENNNIKAKIRQQLQVLRDKGIIEFLGAGRYRKIKAD